MADSLDDLLVDDDGDADLYTVGLIRQRGGSESRAMHEQSAVEGAKKWAWGEGSREGQGCFSAFTDFL